MAPRKPKNDKDWGGYGSKDAYYKAIQTGKVELDEGGLAKSKMAKLLLTVAKSKALKPVRQTIYNIGESVADDLVSGLGKAPSSVGRILKVSKKSDVYTPQGVFKGSEVFVKKPNLTPKQLEGIWQGKLTRQENQANSLAAAARRGAVYGGVAAGAGIVGGQKAVETVKDIISSANKKARGGGKNKR